MVLEPWSFVLRDSCGNGLRQLDCLGNMVVNIKTWIFVNFLDFLDFQKCTICEDFFKHKLYGDWGLVIELKNESMNEVCSGWQPVTGGCHANPY